MNLKLLRSTLCLLSVSALFVDGAIAQQGVRDANAKFVNDYNAAKFKDAIADAATLQKLHALDPEAALMTAQAYYKAGDLAGCVKYIQENIYLSKDPIIAGRHPVADLLERCQ